MNILDLGCNAGYFSIMSSLYGAKKVIGVELSKKFFSQTFFVREYFENKHNKLYDNVSFINQDVSDVDYSKLGPFDYVFALAILYHIGKHKYGKMTPESINVQNILIKELCKISKNFIVRSRKGKNKNTEYYTKLFSMNGFRLVKVIHEGKRDLILYSKVGRK
jgi:SAM-dependent methyltransferase